MALAGHATHVFSTADHTRFSVVQKQLTNWKNSGEAATAQPSRPGHGHWLGQVMPVLGSGSSDEVVALESSAVAGASEMAVEWMLRSCRLGAMLCILVRVNVRSRPVLFDRSSNDNVSSDMIVLELLTTQLSEVKELFASDRVRTERVRYARKSQTSPSSKLLSRYRF